jgi:hypothetical protein
MKRVPSFSVAANDSDISSDEEKNLHTQTKKAGEVLTIESIRCYRAKMKAPRVALAS